MSELLTFDTPMMISAIILALTFVGIFTEEFHGFHRTKFALGGAVVMVIVGQIFGFYNPELALHAIDWNVVFLLMFMMTLIAILAPTGGFQAIAYWIADLSKGRLFFLLAMLGAAVSGISLLLDNVTTVVIFGPLIVLICQALKVSPVPYLIAAAMLSNTGGIATLVGDPPNLMIGSAAGFDFNTFIMKMGVPVLAIWFVSLFMMKIVFRKELSVQAETPHFEEKEHVKDPRNWYAGLAVLATMIVLFVMHGAFHWDAWFVAAIGLALMLFAGSKIDIDKTFEDVEITLLLFFISLFIVVGGVEHSQFLQWVGQFMLPVIESDLLLATILLLWASAFLSAAIDNIPFTAAMIPILLGLEASGANIMPLWWALAIGVGLGGNGTHLGSTANVFVVTLSERIAKQSGDHSVAITPGVWFKRGTPVMLATLVAATVIFYFGFDFFNQEVKRTGSSLPVVEAAEHVEPVAH